MTYSYWQKVFAIAFLAFVFQINLLNAQSVITTIFSDKLPLIDGMQDDIQSYLKEYNFVQLEPENGQSSPSQTKIAVIQSMDALYIAMVCVQNSPVTAKIQVRDKAAQSDDGIFVILDTFNDNRNGYCFGLNPLGTQTDFRLTDDGRTIDYNWDTEWQSSARIYEWGWFAEMVIPFKSLKFRKGETSWQVNFRRLIRNDSEISYWAGAVTEEFKISASGMLNNVNPNVTKNKIMLVPYGMGKVSVLNTNSEKYKYEGQFGGDINWQMTSNLTANMTVNPDFATVEADEDVIDLTKYEIAYPEKRIFFQEGNELFNTRLKSFYSRRIGDISAAGKLTGKIGKSNINFIQAFEKNNIDTSGKIPVYSILRLKRDVLKSSFIGLTATNKLYDNVSKSSFSADYGLNLGKLWKLTGQYVAVVDNWEKLRNAGYVRFAAENNFFHWHLRYSYTDGDGFKEIFNESGYINDDNRNEYDSDLSYKWWMSNRVFKYIQVTAKNNWYWNDDYTKFVSWNINEIADIYFTNKFNISLKYNNEYRYILSENSDNYNYYYSATLGYNTEAYNSADILFRKGRSFGSDYFSIESGVRFKAFNRLSFELRPRYIEFTPETASYKTAFINSLSTTYNFTNDLWVKLICQTNSSNDKIYIYGLAGWRFKPPFGNLYFIANHIEYFDSAGAFQNKYIVFLKLTYPISL